MRKLLLSALLATSLLSNEIVEEAPFSLDLNYLKSLDKGLKRDFYINEYLKMNVNPNAAFQTLSLIDNMNDELFVNFAKKFRDDETMSVALCMKMDTKSLIDTYADCIVTGLSLEDASTLSSIDLDLIMQKTEDKYPEFTKKLKVISSAIPFTKLIVQKKDMFYDIYLNVSNEFRTKYFNYKLPKRTFAKIFADKSSFEKFIKVSISNFKLKKAHKLLLDIDDKDLNANSSFYLSLNAIRQNDLNKAYIFLNNAYEKSTDKVFSDKILFWQYLITKDELILETLSNSLNLNLYSYYANELLEKPLNDSAFLHRSELFDNLEYDKSRIALLYSLGKVKSNFNSKLISNNFKVGIFQLNPSIIKTSSESLNEDYNIFKQFSLEDSLKYANLHLNSLENSFKTPYLLQKVYSSDIKEFNEKINNGYFNKSAFFEPYVSYELFKNSSNDDEFLLYYVLYYNSLTKDDKEKTSLKSIFESLIEPAQKLHE